MAIDTNGVIYTTGLDYNTETGDFYWITRASSNAGGTWSIVDTMPYSGQSGLGLAMTSDDKGNVYSGGIYFDSNGCDNWYIRRGKNSGKFWTTISRYSRTSGVSTKYTNSLGLHYDKTSGDLFAVGIGDFNSQFHTSTTGYWVVRRSTDDGKTWTTIDDYQLVESKKAMAEKFTMDLDGNYYVTGIALDSNNIRHWITRKSTDKGTTWATVDDYQADANNHAGAYEIKTDQDGSIYALGYGIDGGGKYHWIVRKFSCEEAANDEE